MTMMRRNARFYVPFLFLAAVIALAGPIAAQQQRGDTELQLQGTLLLSTGSDFDDVGSLFVNWGRFFTEHQEAGIAVAGAFTSDGDFGGLVGPFYRYNFATGEVVPYVGAGASYAFSSFPGAGSDTTVTLEGGVRWFLARNIAFNVGGTTYYDVDQSDLSDFIQVLFGFSYFWN